MLPVNLAVVAGARPNFMKIAPLMKALAGDSDFHPVLIHTGQHYDDNMSGSFFRDLGIPAPQHHLEVGSGSHAQQTAEIMRRIEPVLIAGEARRDHRRRRRQFHRRLPPWSPRNSTSTVVHVEAGLRSFDRTMPEEINRLVTDSISDLFSSPRRAAASTCCAKALRPRRIHMVGNLMIDSLRQNVERAKESDIAERLGMGGKTLRRRYPASTRQRRRPCRAGRDHGCAACHRREHAAVLAGPSAHPRPPRRRQRPLPREMRLLEPLGYLDFLSLKPERRSCSPTPAAFRKRPPCWACTASPCATTPSGP